MNRFGVTVRVSVPPIRLCETLRVPAGDADAQCEGLETRDACGRRDAVSVTTEEAPADTLPEGGDDAVAVPDELGLSVASDDATAEGVKTIERENDDVLRAESENVALDDAVTLIGALAVALPLMLEETVGGGVAFDVSDGEALSVTAAGVEEKE